MNRVIAAVLVAVACAACGTVEPNAGEEAVLTYKPMFFGDGGVDPTPVKPGLTYIALTTSATIVNMYPQRVDLEFDDLMTADGVPIDFHAVVPFQITDSVKLVQKFGNDMIQLPNGTVMPGFFQRVLEQPFRTAVRDEVKRHGTNAIAILATAAEEVDAKVSQHLEQIVKAADVPIMLGDLSLGRANPPDAVKTQRVETAAQEQRVLTEAQRKRAEDMRKAAEESRAAADEAYNAKMNLSPAQYIELQEISMKREVCGKEGKGGCTFLFGAANPLISLRGN